jgi:hypothetical protein
MIVVVFLIFFPFFYFDITFEFITSNQEMVITIVNYMIVFAIFFKFSIL